MNLLDEDNKPYLFLIAFSLLFFILAGFFFLREETFLLEELGDNDVTENQSDSEIFSHFFRKANEAFLENNLDLSEQYLKRVEALTKNNVQNYTFYITRASIEKKKNLPNKSLESIAEALTFRKTSFALYLKGCVLEMLGRHEEMEDALKKSLSYDGNYQPTHEKLGDFYFFKEDYISAAKYYRQADLSNMSLPSITLKLAFVDHYLGDYGKSNGSIAKLRGTEKNKHLPFIYFLQALNYFKLGENEEAEQNFEKAVASALPNQRGVYLYYWALSNIYRKDYNDAAMLLSQALFVVSEEQQLHKHAKEKMAEATYLSGDFEAAKELYLGLHKQNGELITPIARYNIAVIHYQTKDYEGAIPLFQEVLKQPLDDDVLQSASYLLAKSYAQLDMYEDSRNVLKNYTARWGNSAVVAYTLLQLEADHSEESFLTIYDKYIKENDNENYRLILAQYFINIGENVSAINILSEYALENPSASLLKKLADLYSTEREFDLALYLYKQAERLTGSDEKQREILNNKAFVLAMNEDIAGAKKILQDLEKVPGSNVAQWFNLALIANIEGDNKKYIENIRQAYFYIDDVRDEKLISNIYLHYAIINAREYRLRLARKLIDQAYVLNKDNEKIMFFYNNGFKSLLN